jgi:hypothetical protein
MPAHISKHTAAAAPVIILTPPTLGIPFMQAPAAHRWGIHPTLFIVLGSWRFDRV